MTRPPSESPRAPRLTWTAAFLLTLCLAAAALGSTRITERWGQLPAIAAVAAPALLLLLVLVLLLVQHRAAESGVAWQEAETGQLAEQIKQYQAELAQRATAAQQLQDQLARCMSELDQREDQRRADASARAAALEKVFGELIRVQLPLAFSGSPVPPVPAEAAAGDRELAGLCGELLAAVSSSTAQLHEQLDDQRETARLAVVALARRVQASAHRIQEEATRMAQRHSSDPDVLESSMRVDHAAAQQARHAQSMAVLSGEWPGQQWMEPLALVDVARAAAGRIVAYQRVSVSGDPEVAAVPRVAEPLIHLIAELLANATQSSPPASQVLVTVRTVQRGAVIEIDDGGVGMDEYRLQETREVVSGQRPATLTSLGEIPQTGLAVVGQYARRHGLGVDLVPSPYGGVRAVTLIPAELVQIIEPAGATPARETTPALAAPQGFPPSRTGRHGRPDRAVASPAAPAQEPAPAAAAGLPAEGLAVGDPSAGSWAADGRDQPELDRRQGPAVPAAAGAAEPAPGQEPPDGGRPAQQVPVAGGTGGGLPQRRSRRDEARPPGQREAGALPTVPQPAVTGPLPTPAEVGQWMGAFLSAGVPAGAGPGASGDAEHHRQRHEE